jgi:hypothetical protein
MPDGLLISKEDSGLTLKLPDDPFLGSHGVTHHWEVDPDDRRLRHQALGSGGWPTSEVRLSRPVTATLTSDDVDGDLRAFVRDQRATFDVVHVACGFKPAHGERLEMAELHVELSVSPSDYPEPTTWSMQPLLRSAGGASTTTVKVGADLKLINMGVDLTRSSNEQFCIQASGELTSRPSWIIRRVAGYRLDRDERFMLIVRRERGTQLRAQFTLVSSMTRREGLRRCRYGKYTQQWLPAMPASERQSGWDPGDPNDPTAAYLKDPEKWSREQ